MKLLSSEELQICKNLYENEKIGMKEISERIGLKYNDIRQSFIKAGIKRRELGECKIITSPETESQIIEDYKSGLSLRALCRKYNYDRCVFMRILRTNGIKFRNVLDANQKVFFDKELTIKLFKDGLNYVQISKQLNVSYPTIYKFLKKNNYLSPTAAYFASLPKREQYSKFPEYEIVKDYQSGNVSCSEIARKYNTGCGEISKIIKRHGIKIKEGREIRKSFKINEDYFKNPHSPEKYTALGLYFTDGFNEVNKKFITTIELQEQDKETLEFLQKQFETNKPLRYNKKKKTFCLYLTNKTVALDLAALGCRSPKSYDLKYPSYIKDEFFKHFLHGCIMGDGYVYTSQETNFGVGFTGTEDMCRKIKKNLRV